MHHKIFPSTPKIIFFKEIFYILFLEKQKERKKLFYIKEIKIKNEKNYLESYKN